MNKIFIAMFLLLAVINPVQAEEEQKFVNSLFYKTMEPVSPMAWRTKITPNQVVSDNKGTVLKQKCTLIENTMDAVTLQCEGAYEKSITTQYRFVPQEKSYTGLIVYIFDKYPSEKKFISKSTLIIPYDNK